MSDGGGSSSSSSSSSSASSGGGSDSFGSTTSHDSMGGGGIGTVTDTAVDTAPDTAPVAALSPADLAELELAEYVSSDKQASAAPEASVTETGGGGTSGPHGTSESGSAPVTDSPGPAPTADSGGMSGPHGT